MPTHYANNGCFKIPAALCLDHESSQAAGRGDDLHIDGGAAGNPRRSVAAVRAVWRRLLARKGHRGWLSARISPGDGRGGLARYRDAPGIWRERARHHRGGGTDAGGCRKRRRVFGRLGDPHEHLRAASGRGFRQRRTKATLFAAVDRRSGKDLFCRDRTRCRSRHHAAQDPRRASRRSLCALGPEDLDLDRASRRENADPGAHDSGRRGCAPVAGNDSVLYRSRPQQGRSARNPQNGSQGGRFRTCYLSMGSKCLSRTASARREGGSITSSTA